MARLKREDLKTKFVTNSKPTQQDFADIFDSYYNRTDDIISGTTPADIVQVEAGERANQYVDPFVYKLAFDRRAVSADDASVGRVDNDNLKYITPASLLQGQSLRTANADDLTTGTDGLKRVTSKTLRDEVKRLGSGTINIDGNIKMAIGQSQVIGGEIIKRGSLDIVRKPLNNDRGYALRIIGPSPTPSVLNALTDRVYAVYRINIYGNFKWSFNLVLIKGKITGEDNNESRFRVLYDEIGYPIRTTGGDERIVAVNPFIYGEQVQIKDSGVLQREVTDLRDSKQFTNVFPSEGRQFNDIIVPAFLGSTDPEIAEPVSNDVFLYRNITNLNYDVRCLYYYSPPSNTRELDKIYIRSINILTRPKGGTFGTNATLIHIRDIPEPRLDNAQLADARGASTLTKDINDAVEDKVPKKLTSSDLTLLLSNPADGTAAKTQRDALISRLNREKKYIPGEFAPRLGGGGSGGGDSSAQLLLEQQAREQADSDLGDRIDAEATARQRADEQLQTNIDNVEPNWDDVQGKPDKFPADGDETTQPDKNKLTQVHEKEELIIPETKLDQTRGASLSIPTIRATGSGRARVRVYSVRFAEPIQHEIIDIDLSFNNGNITGAALYARRLEGANPPISLSKIVLRGGALHIGSDNTVGGVSFCAYSLRDLAVKGGNVSGDIQVSNTAINHTTWGGYTALIRRNYLGQANRLYSNDLSSSFTKEEIEAELDKKGTGDGNMLVEFTNGEVRPFVRAQEYKKGEIVKYENKVWVANENLTRGQTANSSHFPGGGQGWDILAILSATGGGDGASTIAQVTGLQNALNAKLNKTDKATSAEVVSGARVDKYAPPNVLKVELDKKATTNALTTGLNARQTTTQADAKYQTKTATTTALALKQDRVENYSVSALLPNGESLPIKVLSPNLLDRFHATSGDYKFIFKGYMPTLTGIGGITATHLKRVEVGGQPVRTNTALQTGEYIRNGDFQLIFGIPSTELNNIKTNIGNGLDFQLRQVNDALSKLVTIPADRRSRTAWIKKSDIDPAALTGTGGTPATVSATYRKYNASGTNFSGTTIRQLTLAHDEGKDAGSMIAPSTGSRGYLNLKNGTYIITPHITLASSGTTSKRSTFRLLVRSGQSGTTVLSRADDIAYDRNLSSFNYVGVSASLIVNIQSNTGSMDVNIAIQRSAGEDNASAFSIQTASTRPSHVDIHLIGGIKGDKGDPGPAGRDGAAADTARLLPALPAEGSRNDKILRFNNNTLQWEDLAVSGGGGSADGRVYFTGDRPAESLGKTGDVAFRRQTNGVGVYERMATNDGSGRKWHFIRTWDLVPIPPSRGSRDGKFVGYTGDTYGWKEPPVDTAEQIRDKLQSLTGAAQLDASAIKNLASALGANVFENQIQKIIEKDNNGVNIEQITVPSTRSVLFFQLSADNTYSATYTELVYHLHTFDPNRELLAIYEILIKLQQNTTAGNPVGIKIKMRTLSTTGVYRDNHGDPLVRQSNDTGKVSYITMQRTFTQSRQTFYGNRYYTLYRAGKRTASQDALYDRVTVIPNHTGSEIPTAVTTMRVNKQINAFNQIQLGIIPANYFGQDKVFKPTANTRFTKTNTLVITMTSPYQGTTSDIRGCLLGEMWLTLMATNFRSGYTQAQYRSSIYKAYFVIEETASPSGGTNWIVRNFTGGWSVNQSVAGSQVTVTSRGGTAISTLTFNDHAIEGSQAVYSGNSSELRLCSQLFVHVHPTSSFNQINLEQVFSLSGTYLPSALNGALTFRLPTHPGG